jgi:hypothetical protein
MFVADVWSFVLEGVGWLVLFSFPSRRLFIHACLPVHTMWNMRNEISIQYKNTKNKQQTNKQDVKWQLPQSSQ